MVKRYGMDEFERWFHAGCPKVNVVSILYGMCKAVEGLWWIKEAETKETGEKVFRQDWANNFGNGLEVFNTKKEKSVK